MHETVDGQGRAVLVRHLGHGNSAGPIGKPPARRETTPRGNAGSTQRQSSAGQLLRSRRVAGLHGVLRTGARVGGALLCERGDSGAYRGGTTPEAQKLQHTALRTPESQTSHAERQHCNSRAVPARCWRRVLAADMQDPRDAARSSEIASAGASP